MSNVSTVVPAAGNATTESVRQNFAVIKAELETSEAHQAQSDIHAPLPARVTAQEIEDGDSAATRLWSPVDVATAVETFQSGVDPTPSTSPLWLDGSVAATEITDGDVAVVATHFDDEILWMLPALQIAKTNALIMIPFSARQQTVLEAMPAWYQARTRTLLGITSNSDYVNIWADQTARESLLQREAVRARVWRAVFDTPAHNIVTHNPWGEYGHMHHRMVSEEVIAACVEYGKSCWYSDIYIPDDNGAIGGDAAEDYQSSGLTLLDYVTGRMSRVDLEALRQVFVDVDVALTGDGLPNSWTWDDVFHPAYSDGGAGYVDWAYHRVVHDGVEDTSDSVAIAALQAALPLFGCPGGVCAYYP
jgi:hypothetical protein